MASSEDLPHVDLTGTITERQFRQLKCINRLCNSGDDLMDAIELTCSYYHVDYKPGKEVCTPCFNQCISHYKLLESKWFSGECILKTNFPNFVSHLLIESSSSSEDEGESELDEKYTNAIKKLTEAWFDKNKSAVSEQVKKCDDYLKELYDNCQDGLDKIYRMCNEIESEVYEMRSEIYKPFKPTVEYLPPVDMSELQFKRAIEDVVEKQSKKSKLDNGTNKEEDDNVEVTSDETICPSPADLPVVGPQEYPPLKGGDWVFGMRSGVLEPWIKCKIKSMINKDYLHIKFNHDEKLLTTKEVAYLTQNPVRFRVGLRVIATKRNTPNTLTSNSLFAGVICEPPTPLNKFRYLIFFDDGSVAYLPHKNIRLVVHKTSKVWNDVHCESKEFLQNYLETYPERLMVRLKKLDIIRVELKDRWRLAKVIEVDASIVKLYFAEFKLFEWLYRGSPRLLIIHEKLCKLGKGIRLRQSGLAYLNKPIIEFTSLEEPESKSVARKSTCKPSTSSYKFSNDISINDELWQVITITLPQNVPQPKPFSVHRCNSTCVDWTGYDYIKTKRMSMLSIPLHFGFRRILTFFNGNHKYVMYKTPCGLIVRNMKEMFDYLTCVGSKMTIDQFDFSSWVKPLAEYRVLKSNKFLNDLSSGKEFRGITCVNSIDDKLPPPMKYMTSRQAMPGVNINVDSNFLCGCDCTDNCEDKSKCACWQLTIEGQKILPNLCKDPDIGYNYRRLPERVLTGIYECNKTCKCSSSCLNRVVQYPLSQKLQLFLTEKKGWGVRCLNDIPQGSFICIYVGFLLTETDANEGGINYGDEYLAELDYIEVVEKIKEDYESDVPPVSDQENSDSNDNDESFRMSESSDEDYRSTSAGKNTSNIALRLRKRQQPINDTTPKKNDTTLKSNKYDTKDNPNPSKSVREYFGENESVYIMDAKTSGNIGRYLNHSCSPNTFVQNVFVDTHDLRFPWVSFFALHYIAAGSELTWDYSYDVGSVPGKVMKCHCDSKLCRGRLL